MYDAVTVDTDASHGLPRIVDTASAYGFDGVVVRNASEISASPDSSAGDEFDVVDAATVRTSDPQQASGTVGNLRSAATLVLVEGGSPEVNRFAVENEKVDVLARPMADDGDVNHVLAKAAADNGVRLEFDLGPVLRTTGGRRVRAIQSLGKLYEIVDHYDAPYVVTAGAASRLELRAPRELAALGEQLGLPESWLRDGFAEWGRLAARNRRVRSESFIEPGVERGRYETER